VEIKKPVNAFRSTLYILKQSFVEYPVQSFIVILSIVITGFAESFSLLTFLPLLQIGLTRISTEQAANVVAQDPSFIDQVFDRFFEFIGLEPTLAVLLGLIVIMITIKSIGMLVTRAYIGIVSARVATDLRMNLIKALLGTSWRYFTSHATGRFSNAISTEAQRASNTYLSAWNMIGAAIQIGFFVLASAAVSMEVLIYGIGAGVLIMAMLHWTVKMARVAGMAETNLMNSLIARLSDNISGIKPLKAMGLEQKILPILEGDSEGLRRAQNSQAFASAAQGNLSEPLMMLIMAVGVYYALEHMDITLAHLAVVALFFNRMVGRMSQFQKFYQMINVSESAYHSINNVIHDAIEATPKRNHNGHVPLLTKEIKLEHLGFSYEGTKILDDFSLTIPANQVTAIVGPSGCGKTTIADIVTGLLEPQTGRVYVDDVPMDQVDPQKWHEMIGYVPQELYLFHDTLRSNITLKDAQISDDAVWAALARSDAKDFVEALPEKLDTVIGERGSKLSGGQRQRLMIARALVRDPKLLILDEATTALDPQTERALCKTVKDLAKSVTILAISHQPAIKEIAHQVIDLTPRG